MPVFSECHWQLFEMDRLKCKLVFEYEDLVYAFAPLFSIANSPFGDSKDLFNMLCNLCRLICVVLILSSWLTVLTFVFSFLVLQYSMRFHFLNAFVLVYSKNVKAQRLCRNCSRLIATSFLLNTLVCTNEICMVFHFYKNSLFS